MWRALSLALVLGCGGGAAAPAAPEPVPVPPAAPAPSAADPVPRAEPSPPPSGELGTAHPLFVQRAAPDGRWVAACQARADTDGDGQVMVHTGHHGELFGDRVELFLMSAEEPEGERIDALVASDPSGRFVAFVRDGRLVLRDTDEGRDVDLSESARADDNPTMPHRGAEFDAGGTRLSYLRMVGGTERLIVRELATGAERTVDTGPGRLWRASFLGDGSWVFAAVVPADTNGNGRLDLPAQQTTLAGGACRGAPASYSTYGYRGDDFERRFLRLSDGRREGREVVAFDGDALVVRDSSGALRWVTAGGEDREVVPVACGAQVIAVFAPSRALLVACAAGGGQAPLRVYDDAGPHDLGIEVPADPHARWSAGRIVPVGGSHLVDLAQARLFPRAYAGEQAIVDAIVLETVRGGVVRVRDLETGRTTDLTGGTDRYVYGEQWGRLAAVRHDTVLLVDVPAARLLGSLPALPVAVRSDGLALVPASDDLRAPRGPLRWLPPD